MLTMVLLVQMISSLLTKKVSNLKNSINNALVRTFFYLIGITFYTFVLSRYAHRSLFEMTGMNQLVLGVVILIVVGFISDWLKIRSKRVLICQILSLLVGLIGAVAIFMIVTPRVEYLVLEVAYLKVVLMAIAVITGNGLVKAVLEDASLSRSSDGSNLGRKIGYIERFICVMGIWVAEINLILAFIALKTLARHKLMDDVHFSEIYLLGTSVSMTYAITFGYGIRNLEQAMTYLISVFI